ncbi:DUF4271 domain-containing protein [Dysgonomonas sp. 25]|uniref:DUF4271 domain-containing protein n=1 Tax=Dysgonomonas sp. 25 TaxID=2302933 RepID=UPI0013D415A8|nr:DUF4271 domain-containing protein [Dysgonomonas sp. 25]
MANGITTHEGIPLPFSLDQTNAAFILVLICLISFAFIYKGDFATMKVNLYALVSFNRNKRIETEYTVKNTWHTYYLILQFTILSSISIYSILSEQMGYEAEHHPLRTIALFGLFVSLFIFAKFLIYNLVGFIYNMQEEITLFKHWSIVLMEFLGISYFIPTLLLLYADYWHTEIALFMIALFIIAQLILFCRLIVYFVREKLNFLFLIAYLCSVEIIPCIFLASGLLFLYKTDELTVLW